MVREYRQGGLSFHYPPSWELTEEVSDRQRTITLQTAGASFWTLTIFDDRPDPERILNTVVDAFQQEYDDVDVYSVPPTTHQPFAAAADLDFIYLDTVTSVAIRAFQTEDVSAVVMYQGTDQELEILRPQFDAVTESVVFARG